MLDHTPFTHEQIAADVIKIITKPRLSSHSVNDFIKVNEEIRRWLEVTQGLSMQRKVYDAIKPTLTAWAKTSEDAESPKLHHKKQFQIWYLYADSQSYHRECESFKQSCLKSISGIKKMNWLMVGLVCMGTLALLVFHPALTITLSALLGVCIAGVVMTLMTRYLGRKGLLKVFGDYKQSMQAIFEDEKADFFSDVDHSRFSEVEAVQYSEDQITQIFSKYLQERSTMEQKWYCDAWRTTFAEEHPASMLYFKEMTQILFTQNDDPVALVKSPEFITLCKDIVGPRPRNSGEGHSQVKWLLDYVRDVFQFNHRPDKQLDALKQSHAQATEQREWLEIKPNAGWRTKIKRFFTWHSNPYKYISDLAEINKINVKLTSQQAQFQKEYDFFSALIKALICHTQCPMTKRMLWDDYVWSSERQALDKRASRNFSHRHIHELFERELICIQQSPPYLSSDEIPRPLAKARANRDGTGDNTVVQHLSPSMVFLSSCGEGQDPEKNNQDKGALDKEVGTTKRDETQGQLGYLFASLRFK